jgi:Fanconi anemia group M protein
MSPAAHLCLACAASLFQNTLVTLGTGLGKTLVGAVVLYNFYRWWPLHARGPACADCCVSPRFPTGKLIFVAPNKPLLEQQCETLHKYTHIDRDDVVFLSGLTPENRKKHWMRKRLFFATAQIIHNDLAKDPHPPPNHPHPHPNPRTRRSPARWCVSSSTRRTMPLGSMPT